MVDSAPMTLPQLNSAILFTQTVSTHFCNLLFLCAQRCFLDQASNITRSAGQIRIQVSGLQTRLLGSHPLNSIWASTFPVSPACPQPPSDSCHAALPCVTKSLGRVYDCTFPRMRKTNTVRFVQGDAGGAW